MLFKYRNPIKMTFNTLNPKSKRLKIQKSKSLLSDLPLLLFLASSFFISITYFTIFLLLAFQPKKKKKKWQETIQMNFNIYSKNVTPGWEGPREVVFFFIPNIYFLVFGIFLLLLFLCMNIYSHLKIEKRRTTVDNISSFVVDIRDT